VTEKIVARSYDKFFNLGERFETKLDALARTLVFPVVAYKKGNGFLGITGFDDEKDNVEDPTGGLIVASKTTLTGPYAQLFRSMLEEHAKQYMVHPGSSPDSLSDESNAENIKLFLERFAEFLRDNNASATFEVIHPEKDPHIIEYDRPRLILLDVINRTDVYHKWPLDKVVEVADVFGFETNKRPEDLIHFNNWAEFRAWYDAQQQGWDPDTEGWVIEDAKGFMTKFKLPFYNFWKKMRWLREKLCERSPQIRGGFIQTPEEQKVFKFMKTIPRDKLGAKRGLQHVMSIIEIRREYLASLEAVLIQQEA